MFEELKKFLVEELRLNEADIKMESELSGDLGINSLELADLVYACEEKFDEIMKSAIKVARKVESDCEIYPS